MSRAIAPHAQQRRRQALRAPDQRAQPRQQLLEVKGLGEVVVGAGVDAGDLLVPAVARGEDQHRHRAPAGAPAPEHAQAVEPRQSEIEHDRVEGFGLAQVLRVGPVAGLVDRVAGVFEPGAQLCAQQRVVLDEQDPHRAPPAAEPRRLTASTCAVAASTLSLSSCPPACSSFTS